MGPVPLGGSCEGRKVSVHWEVPSLMGTERELWKREELAEEHSNREQSGERLAEMVSAAAQSSPA